MIFPRVVDISHHDSVAPNGFQQARKAGIWGVIHKATESTAVIDYTYNERRRAALAAGMLWGAYHFIRPGSIEIQLGHFLAVAKPDDRTLVALDWEVDPVSVEMAEEFLQGVKRKLGRKAWVYSGNTAKEKLGARSDAFFGSHRLWLAQYSMRPICQRSWARADLWQYTGDGVGLLPHKIQGISIPGSGIDINHYDGPLEQLTADWVTDKEVTAPNPNELHGVYWVQASLNRLGATPQLVVDGDLGPRTIEAVKQFQLKQALVVDGVIGAITTAAIDLQLAILHSGK